MTRTLTITDEPQTVEERAAFLRKTTLIGMIATEVTNAAIIRNEPWKRADGELFITLLFKDNSELEDICKKAGINI